MGPPGGPGRSRMASGWPSSASTLVVPAARGRRPATPRPGPAAADQGRQRAPEQLAGRRPGDCGGFDDAGRHLERSQTFAGERPKRLRVFVGARAERDDGDGDGAPLLVRDAHDADVGDGRMARQDGLDLGGSDVLAARDDDLVAAGHDAEPAFRVQAAQIAGVQPAFRVEGGRGRFGVVLVAVEDHRAANQDLAVRVGRGRGAVGSLDPKLDAGQRSSGRPGAATGVAERHRDHAGGRLRHAIAGDDRPAGGHGTGYQRFGDRAAAQENGTKLRRGHAPRGIEKAAELRGHQRDMADVHARRPSGPEAGHDRLVVRRDGHDYRDAGPGRPHDNPYARDVGEVEREQPAGRGRQNRGPCLGAGIELGRPEPDELRPAGGPGGGDDDGRRAGRRGRRARRGAGRRRGTRLEQVLEVESLNPLDRLERRVRGARRDHRAKARTGRDGGHFRPCQPRSDRHRDDAGPDDSVERGDRSGRGRGEQPDPIAGLDPGRGQPGRDGVRPAVKLRPRPAQAAVEDGGVVGTKAGVCARCLDERRRGGHGRPPCRSTA